MNERWRLARLALLALFATTAAIGAAPLCALAAPNAVPGELIVRYKNGVSQSRREQAESAIPSLARVQHLTLIGADHLRVSAISADEALARLRANPDVAYAEPNYYVYAQMIPNDPSFAQLWGMKNTGQGGGYAGADIKATLAWDLYTGDPGLRIGVIDTGIDYTHPDLAANVWTNPGETPGNGRDDDGNGYVDDVHGYDFVNHDGDPMDDGFHGTHVAGTIGAVGNNGVGVTGVAWRCRMVAIKFMDASGVGTEADAIAAIGYSVTVGCKLTNNSWGNMSGGQALLDAINAAGAAGQLMVFAAGNNGWNIDAVPFYPPSYVAPNMITVTSTDGRDLRPTLTNYGAATVNLGAPGYSIYSCKPGALYQSLNGTSMAAPHVTGAAALAMGRSPYATISQIRQLILASTDPIASMSGLTSTGGRLNAYKVLLNGDAAPPSRVANLAIADIGSTALGLSWSAPGDDSTAGTATRYDLRVSPSVIDGTNFDVATPVPLAVPQVGGTAEIAEVTGLAFVTRYHFALRAIDDFGNPSPVSNDVSATTLGIPTLALAPGSFSVFLAPGAVCDTTLHVANIGQGRLDFHVPVPAPTPWLSATPDSGRVPSGAGVTVALHVDATGLADGNYDTSLPLVGNDPVTPAATIPIHLVVNVLTGVGDPSGLTFGFRARSSTPATGPVQLELALPHGGPVDVSIFDVGGRRVARLAQGMAAAGVHPLRWGGAGPGGAPIASGLYFARARTREGSSVLRIVMLH
jgi:subtilisin family serine protease